MSKIVLSICVLLVYINANGYAQEEFKYEKQIDALVQPYLENNKFFAASVVVISDGKTWFGNWGQLSDSDASKPTNQTVYEIGSISKVFTSLLLADAVESDDLSLDMTVSELVPALKESEPCQDITLLHLSTHMSGLPKMPTNTAPKEPNNPYADYSREMMHKYLDSAELQSKPGKKHEYSNLGAGLLGDLLAARKDGDYETLLKNRVLVPLRMNDTTLTLSASQHKRCAPPHNSALLADHAWDFDALAGAGAIRSTTSDMVKFMKANLDPPEGEIGKALNLAWKQHLPASATHRAMGLGWQIAGDGSTRWHNGQTGGYQSMMLVSRKLNAAVILLCNTGGSEVDALAEGMFQTIVGMKVEPQNFEAAVKVDEETIDRLVGKYQLAPGLVLDVVAKNGNMMVQLTGQTFLSVDPESETVWNLRDVEAQLRFDLPNKGPAKKVTLHQNGRKMPAPRIKK